MNTYPEEAEIKQLETFKPNDGESLRDAFLRMMDFVHELWEYKEFGWTHIEDKNGEHHFILATAGWSGNEEIIGAMRSNFLTHTFFRSMHVGGLYHYTTADYWNI